MQRSKQPGVIRYSINRRRTQRGSATLVEFALVASILMVFTMAIIQYGIIANAVNALSHISRDAARYAAVHGLEGTADAAASATTPNNASIRSEIKRMCDISPINYSDVTVTITYPNPLVNGKPVTVSLSYNLSKKFFMPTSFPGLSNISAAPMVRAATELIE